MTPLQQRIGGRARARRLGSAAAGGGGMAAVAFFGGTRRRREVWVQEQREQEDEAHEWKVKLPRGRLRLIKGGEGGEPLHLPTRHEPLHLPAWCVRHAQAQLPTGPAHFPRSVGKRAARLPKPEAYTRSARYWGGCVNASHSVIIRWLIDGL